MNIIVPITITDAMIGAGTTIAEPAAGETAWVSAGSYTAGQYRIRTATHRTYLCLQDHTGRTTAPEDDATYWSDAGPTQRWAPFDIYASTTAETTGSLTYVLSPGFANACAIYGLEGTAYSITVKDAPGGTVIKEQAGRLYTKGPGWYGYRFGQRRVLTKVLLTGIPIRPTAEVTITLTGSTVALGMIVLGHLVPLVGSDASFGGTLEGASAEPVTYSYIDTSDIDGTTTIVRRGSSTGMRATVVMPRKSADEALRRVQSVLDVPVACIASTSNGFDGLNVFGLMSGSMSYTNNIATLNATVKGLV